MRATKTSHSRKPAASRTWSGRRLRHRVSHHGQVTGKPRRPAQVAEIVDHRLRHLVRVIYGGPVGEHRDAELVHITPHGDVQAAAGDQRTNRVDLPHDGTRHLAALAWTRNV